MSLPLNVRPLTHSIQKTLLSIPRIQKLYNPNAHILINTANTPVTTLSTQEKQWLHFGPYLPLFISINYLSTVIYYYFHGLLKWLYTWPPVQYLIRNCATEAKVPVGFKLLLVELRIATLQVFVFQSYYITCKLYKIFTYYFPPIFLIINCVLL
jgi:hypothetical protein